MGLLSSQPEQQACQLIKIRTILVKTSKESSNDKLMQYQAMWNHISHVLYKN